MRGVNEIQFMPLLGRQIAEKRRRNEIALVTANPFGGLLEAKYGGAFGHRPARGVVSAG